MKDTVILLSGGLDSAVLLASERDRIALGLFIEYGQPAEREECAAAQAVAKWGRMHDPKPTFLRYQRLILPGMAGMVAASGAGPRVVPARNLIFLSHAVALALSEGLTRVIYGATGGDVTAYADCRASFVTALSTASRGLGCQIDAPLLGMDKLQVVSLGRELQAPISLSWSCYTPRMGQPCGACNACVERAAALG